MTKLGLKWESHAYTGLVKQKKYLVSLGTCLFWRRLRHQGLALNPLSTMEEALSAETLPGVEYIFFFITLEVPGKRTEK